MLRQRRIRERLRLAELPALTVLLGGVHRSPRQDLAQGDGSERRNAGLSVHEAKSSIIGEDRQLLAHGDCRCVRRRFLTDRPQAGSSSQPRQRA
jgi:hypothetical protein